MTTSLFLLAIICSLQLKMSYLKAGCPQKIASFPGFLMQVLKHVMYWELVYSTLDISEMQVNMYLILKMVPLVWEAYSHNNGIAATESVYCSLHSLRYILCSLAIYSIRSCNNSLFLKQHLTFFETLKTFISKELPDKKYNGIQTVCTRF